MNKYLEESDDDSDTESDDDFNIHEVVKAGTLREVKEVISKDRPRLIALKDKFGRIPLHYSASLNRTRITQYLIGKKSAIDARDNREQTPLHLAATKGLTDMVRTLLELGANIRVKDVDCWTALHMAVDGRLFDTATVLCKRGADLNAEDHRHGRTPLHLAAEKGYHELVEMLIIRGADLYASGDSYYSKTPLHIACLHGHIETVRVLVERNADMSRLSGFLDKTPLHFACEHGHLECAQILAENGADLDQTGIHVNGSTALHICAMHDQVDIARMLLIYGANPMKKGKFTTNGTALHVACQYGHAYMVLLLLTEGNMDINLPDEVFHTPLHLACKFGWYDVAFMLIDLHADFRLKANSGKVALDYVAVPTIKDKMIPFMEKAEATRLRKQLEAEQQREFSERNLMAYADRLERARLEAEAERLRKVQRTAIFTDQLRIAVDVSGELSAILSLAEEYPEQDINVPLFYQMPRFNNGSSLSSAVTSRRPSEISLSSAHLHKEELPVPDGNDTSVMQISAHSTLLSTLALMTADTSLSSASSVSTDIAMRGKRYQECTALIRACSKGYHAVAHALLHWPDIDLNRQESIYGYTALHYAAMIGHRGLIEELLLVGAKSGIMDKNGNVAANLAKTTFLREIIRNPGLIEDKNRYQDAVLEKIFNEKHMREKGFTTVEAAGIVGKVLVTNINSDKLEGTEMKLLKLDQDIAPDVVTVEKAPTKSIKPLLALPVSKKKKSSNTMVKKNSGSSLAMIPEDHSMSEGMGNRGDKKGLIEKVKVEKNKVSSGKLMGEVVEVCWETLQITKGQFVPLPKSFGGSFADFFFAFVINTEDNVEEKKKEKESNPIFLDLLTLQKNYQPTAFDTTDEWIEVKDFLWLLGYPYKNHLSPECDESENNDEAQLQSSFKSLSNTKIDERYLLHNVAIIMDEIQQLFTNTYEMKLASKIDQTIVQIDIGDVVEKSAFHGKKKEDFSFNGKSKSENFLPQIINKPTETDINHQMDKSVPFRKIQKSFGIRDKIGSKLTFSGEGLDEVQWDRIPANISESDAYRLILFSQRCDRFVYLMFKLLGGHFDDSSYLLKHSKNNKNQCQMSFKEIEDQSNNSFLSGGDKFEEESIGSGESKEFIFHLQKSGIINEDFTKYLLDILSVGFDATFRNPQDLKLRKKKLFNKTIESNEHDDSGIKNENFVPNLLMNPPRYRRIAVDAIFELGSALKEKGEASLPLDSVRAHMWVQQGNQILQKQFEEWEKEKNAENEKLNSKETRKLTAAQMWLNDLQLLEYEPYFEHVGFRILSDFVGLSEQDCQEFFPFLKIGDMRRLLKNSVNLDLQKLAEYERKAS